MWSAISGVEQPGKVETRDLHFKISAGQSVTLHMLKDGITGCDDRGLTIIDGRKASVDNH